MSTTDQPSQSPNPAARAGAEAESRQDPDGSPRVANRNHERGDVASPLGSTPIGPRSPVPPHRDPRLHGVGTPGAPSPDLDAQGPAELVPPRRQGRVGVQGEPNPSAEPGPAASAAIARPAVAPSETGDSRPGAARREVRPELPGGAILMPPFPSGAAAGEPPCLSSALWLESAGLPSVVLAAKGEVLRGADGEGVGSDGKRPRAPGFAWAAVTATEESLRAAWAEHPHSGVGVLLGVLPPGRGGNPYWGRRGVVDVEVDDPVAAAPVLRRVFPDGVPDTLRWESNGPGRVHRLFVIDHEVARELRDLGFGATYQGLHQTKSGTVVGDPAYPGLEFRFGSLSPGTLSQTQSVVPPTPRADGTPRAFLGDFIRPFPTTLIADLAALSARALQTAEARERAATPPRPLDRETLLGSPPYDRVKAQLKALRHRFTEGTTQTGHRVISTGCPAHRDDKPSARFAEKELGGKLVCDCYSAGCELAEMLEPLGLRACDAYPGAAADRRASVEDQIRRNLSNVATNGAFDHAGMTEDELARFEREDGECAEALGARPERLRELCRHLGVGEETLRAFGPGWRERNPFRDGEGVWQDYGPAWTFTMVDGLSRPVNVQRRFVDPGTAKRGLSGGRLGLFVPEPWADRDGPVFLVEGASDAATLRDVGLCPVGRPNNTSGAAFASALIKGGGREVVVVGERDAQPDGRWPGDPRAFARDLAGRLGRGVKAVLPPRGRKDVREWRSAAGGDAVRETLLRLASFARPVTPSRSADEAGRGVVKVALPAPNRPGQTRRIEQQGPGDHE